MSSPEKKLRKSNPEVKAPPTYRELAGSSYIVLNDGSVARRLKPKLVGETRYWFLSHEGHLKCLSQRRIDEMTTFP